MYSLSLTLCLPSGGNTLTANKWEGFGLEQQEKESKGY